MTHFIPCSFHCLQIPILLPVTVLTNTLLTNGGRLAGQLFTGDGFNSGLTLLTNTLLTNGGWLAGQISVGDGFIEGLCILLTNTLLTNGGRLAGQLFVGDGFNEGLCILLTNTLLTNGGRLAGQLFVGDGFNEGLNITHQHTTHQWWATCWPALCWWWFQRQTLQPAFHSSWRCACPWSSARSWSQGCSQSGSPPGRSVWECSESRSVQGHIPAQWYALLSMHLTDAASPTACHWWPVEAL